ncbi:TonB-dependent receptor [uncultured Brevundimonas sp.]|uniref:TonB-dependent receptor plug domain-containing protein n=1 Tax=uncultured Brevundimonas sp. TaxID=213418 RepID=UPI0030ED9C26|tara:strand:+ start:240653 stop:242500 length:1848 start_codon:yes stop_codon:yes gene_type:complete
MKRSILLSTVALATLLALPALARTPDDGAEPLPEIIVTATRLPAIVADTPGARVIDAAAIEQRGAVFAADILSDVPGLSVTRSGAYGGIAQVRMRGATPGKTLVLVDGVPVNDAAEINGAFDFSGFDLGEVARIEVLSGPQSSLWGSAAIGGVIAFTTRETDGLRAEVEAGSFDTVRGRLAAGVARDSYAFGAWVSRFDTAGISAADAANGNPEADGFENTSAGARGRYAFSPSVQLDGSVRWSRSEGDLDGYPAPAWVLADTADTTESEQWSATTRLGVEAAGLKHQFSVSAADLTRTTRGSTNSTFTADRQAYRWQATGSALAGRTDFTLGAEREATEGSLSTGANQSQGTTSLFGVSRFQVTDGLSLTAALRRDDTDDFGGATTGRLSAAWDLSGGFILSGAWGTGFKAPSISQSVCDYCYASVPFPDLTPETADSVELALGWGSTDGRVQGRATAYRLNVEDQITYVFNPSTFDSYYINVDRTRTDGVELEGRAFLAGGVDLTLAYAWTDARNPANGARLLRVPEHAGSATLGWTGERLSAALTVRAEGDQLDAGGVRKAFVTAGLNGAWTLTPTVSLTARIDNLTDERYQQVFGYGEPGRSAYVGVRLRY